MSDLFVARQSGTVWIGGRRHAIRADQTIAEEGSEILRLHGKLFKPLRIHYPAATKKRGSDVRPVEQATAVPGELRAPAPAQEWRCDEPGCDATAKSAQGLSAHKRTHRPDDES